MTCALVNPTSGYRTFSRLVSLSVRPSILTSTAVSLAILAYDLLRQLVGPQSLEGGRAELARFRPLYEFEVADKLGFDEVRPLRRRAVIEGAGLSLERLHERCQLIEHGIGESRADLARVYELAILVVADHQRAG